MGTPSFDFSTHWLLHVLRLFAPDGLAVCAFSFSWIVFCPAGSRAPLPCTRMNCSSQAKSVQKKRFTASENGVELAPHTCFNVFVTKASDS
jgi:hypothetical protein